MTGYALCKVYNACRPFNFIGDMLPNLSKLVVAPVAGPKRKATDEIYFKAFRSGEFRKLSNLFGPVEWRYQQAKFKEGSAVYNFLQEGLDKTLSNSFTREEFAERLKAMGHDGKLESYIDTDGLLATGLVAQMTSVIAKNPTSDLARKRLTYILGLPKKISEAEALSWHEAGVHPPLRDEKANAHMLRLLVDKYNIPQYLFTLEGSLASLHAPPLS